jgi:hypothetical protein
VSACPASVERLQVSVSGSTPSLRRLIWMMLLPGLLSPRASARTCPAWNTVPPGAESTTPCRLTTSAAAAADCAALSTGPQVPGTAQKQHPGPDTIGSQMQRPFTSGVKPCARHAACAAEPSPAAILHVECLERCMQK